MSKTKLVCCKCGIKVETIPLHCGQDMNINEKSGQMECYMGPNCGYISLDEYICENCCEKQPHTSLSLDY